MLTCSRSRAAAVTRLLCHQLQPAGARTASCTASYTRIAAPQLVRLNSTSVARIPPATHSSHSSRSSAPFSFRHLALLLGASASSLLLLSFAAPLQAAESQSAAAAADSAAEESKPPYRRLPSTATPAEHAAVEQLKRALAAQLPSLPPELADYVQSWGLDDDFCLLRYLRAHKLHVARAQAGLLATARWRLTERIDDVRIGEFAAKYAGRGMYVSSQADPNGRALIVYVKSGAAQTGEGWSEAQWRMEWRSLVYTLERAVRDMEDRVARGEASLEECELRWVFWVDTGKYTRSSATPWHYTRALLDVMRHHYPERLQTAVILDAPGLLLAFCRLLRPFVDRVTRDKVLFLSRRKEDTPARLQRLMGDLAKLPAESGVQGANTPFDYEQYIREDPLAKPRPDWRHLHKAAGDHKASGEVSLQEELEQQFSAAVNKLKLAFWK